MMAAPSNAAFAKRSKKSNADKEKAKTQKKEIKEWKKRKKQMEPLELKDLVEENSRLKAANLKLEEEVKVHKEASEKVVKLREELQQLQTLQAQKAAQAEKERTEAQDAWAGDGLGSPQKAHATKGKGAASASRAGLVFKVQVGAFDDYWDADKLKEELRSQGKKTWIVCYNQHGERIPLKAILKDILQK